MKLNKIIVHGTFILLGSIAFTTATHAKLNSPQPGILCDQYACADENGLSADLTGNYLDQSKARKISAGDNSQFTFSDGTFCDTNERKCYVDRYFGSNGQRSAVNSYATQRLFGNATPTSSSSSLRSPKPGVLCDENVCADRNGLSKSLTMNYLDQSKAKAISGSGTDITQFTFSDGTFCDAKTKLCHVDRYFESNGKRSAVNRSATQKLFGR